MAFAWGHGQSIDPPSCCGVHWGRIGRRRSRRWLLSWGQNIFSWGQKIPTGQRRKTTGCSWDMGSKINFRGARAIWVLIRRPCLVDTVVDLLTCCEAEHVDRFPMPWFSGAAVRISPQTGWQLLRLHPKFILEGAFHSPCFFSLPCRFLHIVLRTVCLFLGHSRLCLKTLNARKFMPCKEP